MRCDGHRPGAACRQSACRATSGRRARRNLPSADKLTLLYRTTGGQQGRRPRCPWPARRSTGCRGRLRDLSGTDRNGPVSARRRLNQCQVGLALAIPMARPFADRPTAAHAEDTSPWPMLVLPESRAKGRGRKVPRTGRAEAGIAILRNGLAGCHRARREPVAPAEKAMEASGTGEEAWKVIGAPGGRCTILEHGPAA